MIISILITSSWCSKSKLRSTIMSTSKSTAVERPLISFTSLMNEKKRVLKQEYEKFKFKSKGASGDIPRVFKYESLLSGVWESWMLISSSEFKNQVRFPPIQLRNSTYVAIETDLNDFRINKAQCVITGDKKRPFEDDRLFYFNIGSCKLAYTSTPTDVNILGLFDLTNDITDMSKDEDFTSEDLLYCLILTDREGKQWKICSNKEDDIKTALCLTAKCGGKEVGYSFCLEYDSEKPTEVTEVITKQPIILVPLPSPTCNSKWDYSQNGEDWNCVCKNGNEQSPIDLPNQSNSIISEVKPSFNYNLVSYNTEPSIDGSVSNFLRIKNNGKYLHILDNDMGKIITEDGTVFQAQEIMFHTPSNHKINGKQYDLEVVIIHSGITKGDIGKQATLSILFEAAPGIYNKFFDDIDFFNLPNPYTKSSDLVKGLYIPKLFYDSSEDDIELKPFSFYTYQGSLMVPPCSEQTIVYVAAKPLKISNTVLTLFKEALKKPDLVSKSSGKVYTSQSVGASSRKIQPINGRPVFFYESCETQKSEKRQEGHYEKIIDKATQYFYVSGSKPSGVPGSFVVTEDEANGFQK